MSNKKRNKTSSSTKKKSCSMLKKEWLSEIIETKIPSSKHRQKVKDWRETFINPETDDVVRSICSEANAL
jgi:hypothetical protein